jgi:hypothetical protein
LILGKNMMKMHSMYINSESISNETDDNDSQYVYIYIYMNIGAQQLLSGPSISRAPRQIPERVRTFLQSSSARSNIEIKTSEISQISYRALLGPRRAREPYYMNILEICGDLMWLSDDALRFSFLFMIPIALRSASIPTSQIQPWSENHLSQGWLMRSIVHCAHVISSPPLSSPDWCARPAIGHSLGIKCRGFTEGHRS